MNSGLAPRSTASGSAGRPAAIRAISRAASASGSRSPSVAVAEPDLLILDEPTRGVDPERKAALGAWLEEYAASGKAVARRDPRPRPAGAPANRTLCFRNTSGSSGGARWRLGSPRLAAAAALALAAWAALDPARGGIATLLAAVAVLVAGFAWLEGGTVSARDLTLVATLGGLAAAGRVLFAPIPSVQPVTVIVAAVGRRARAASRLRRRRARRDRVELLPRPGRRTRPGRCSRGAAAASSPACCAGSSGAGSRSRPSRSCLGFAFGMLMDVWLWFAFYPHTEAALLARLAAGVPFNVAHAAGNVVLALVAGPELRRVLERYERKLANGGRLGVKLLATLAAVAALATPAGYVQAQQREDGGFGDAQITAWATLGLVAAGKDTGGAAEYLARQQEPATATDRRARSRWRAPRRATGRTTCSPRLRAYQPGKLVNATIWTILALRQAGEPAPPALVQALRAAQRPNGGWSWLAGGARRRERHGRRDPGAPRRRRDGDGRSTAASPSSAATRTATAASS